MDDNEAPRNEVILNTGDTLLAHVKCWPFGLRPLTKPFTARENIFIETMRSLSRSLNC